MPSSFAARTSESMQNPSKNGPKRARGYPLESPERSKTAQGHPGALQETPRDGPKASPRASGSALEALWTRLERRWGFQRRPRARNGCKLVAKSSSKVYRSRFQDLISSFTHLLIVFGVRRYSKVFKLYRKNAMILNSRVVHSQDTTMQTVFEKTCRNTSKIKQNLIENAAQTVPDATWKDLEGSGGPNGSSGRARRPDSRYIRQI